MGTNRNLPMQKRNLFRHANCLQAKGGQRAAGLGEHLIILQGIVSSSLRAAVVTDEVSYLFSRVDCATWGWSQPKKENSCTEVVQPVQPDTKAGLLCSWILEATFYTCHYYHCLWMDCRFISDWPWAEVYCTSWQTPQCMSTWCLNVLFYEFIHIL